MISFRIWQALHHPPRKHPLFRLILLQAQREVPRPTNVFFMWMMFITGFAFCWTAIYDWLAMFFVVGLLMLNTVYSVLWSTAISGAIVDEKEQNRYDLLAAMPVGTFGISWAMGTGSLHRRSSFMWVPFFIRLGVLITMITLFVVLAITLFVLEHDTIRSASYTANFDLIPLIIRGFGLVIVFYIDHVYSVIQAMLVAMAAPVDVLSGVEARLRTFLGFLALQAVIYGMSGLFALDILPRIFRFFGWLSIEALIVQTVLGVIFFVVLREAITIRLWRWLTRELNAEPRELDLLFKSV